MTDYSPRMFETSSNAWVVVDHPSVAYPGSILRDAVKFADDDVTRANSWFHATTRENWLDDLRASALADGSMPLVHLGTREAAEDRARAVGVRTNQPWFLYQVKVNDDAVLAPEITTDDNDEAPLFSSDVQYFRDYADVTRYVNEFECVGSVSLIADPSKITVVEVRSLSA